MQKKRFEFLADILIPDPFGLSVDVMPEYFRMISAIDWHSQLSYIAYMN